MAELKFFEDVLGIENLLFLAEYGLVWLFWLEAAVISVSCESVMSPVASSDGIFAFIPPGYNGKIPSCNKPVGN